MQDQEQSLLHLLAYAMLQSARPEKAAVLMAALDRLRPGQPPVLRTLALALVRAGKPERALAALDRLAMAGGVDAAFHLLRAQSLGALERPEEASLAMNAYVHLRGEARQGQAS